MNIRYWKKSLPDRIRYIADNTQPAYVAVGDEKGNFWSTTSVSLYKIAKEIQGLLDEAADELGRGIPDWSGNSEMTHVAEMLDIDDLYTALLEAKNGKQ